MSLLPGTQSDNNIAQIHEDVRHVLHGQSLHAQKKNVVGPVRTCLLERCPSFCFLITVCDITKLESREDVKARMNEGKKGGGCRQKKKTGLAQQFRFPVQNTARHDILRILNFF
jgi:hypothetical protein